MEKKIEGTIILDGLIEGPLPEQKNTEYLIREWIKFTADNGLIFYYEKSGSSFSILSENRPVIVDSLPETPNCLITRVLEEFIKIFPADYRSKILSTIRSSEFKKMKEIQTLYSFTNGGKVNPQSREQNVKTLTRPKTFSLQEKIKLTVLGGAVFIILLFFSSFFIDYKSAIDNIISSLTPMEVNKIEINNTLYNRYFRVVGKEKENHHIRLILNPTPYYPIDESQIETYHSNAATLHEKLLLESLQKGYVTYETFDDENHFIDSGTLRVTDLKEKTSIAVHIPFNERIQPAKIRLYY